MTPMIIHNAIRAVLCATVCLLTGCLARPHLEKQSFNFALPSRSAEAGARGSRVLLIRSLQVDPPFDGKELIYRTGEFSYDRDPFAEFLVYPADELRAPVCGRWRESGAFEAVSEGGSALKPNTLVEIHVSQLYGDFRQSEGANAVLVMRFVFFDAPNGVPEEVMLQQEYSRSIPMKARTAAALIEGWNQALAQILDSAALDFGRADANAPKS
jgi:cholesterol transport system auxiliary component